MASKRPQKTSKTPQKPRTTSVSARTSANKKQSGPAKGKTAQSKMEPGQPVQRKKTEKTRERRTPVQETPAQKRPTSTKSEKGAHAQRMKSPRAPSSLKAEELRKATLRRLLLSKREEIVKEVKREISKYIKGETRQLVDTALDDGDWSVVDLSEDISFKHMSTHRENLLKIDEALRKLAEGTYGICEDCGEEISEERLRILPFAIYCTDCQEQKEKLEELEKSEGIIG